MSREVKCPCGALARFAPMPRSRRHGWVCQHCDRTANADDEGRLIEGLASEGLKQARERLKMALLQSDKNAGWLRTQMGMKPWEFRMDFFTEKQVAEALSHLEPEDPRCQYRKAGKQCKRNATHGLFCWQHK